MGHYSASADTDIQSLVNIFPNSGQTGGNFSSPVYFDGYIYFASTSYNVTAFQLTNGLLSTAPTSESSEVYGYRGGTMSISANGNSNGILWTLQSESSGMVPGFIGPGILHAYNATNLGDELYNSNQAAGSRDTLDAWLKFSVPVVANGEVFVASDSELTIYGLLPNPPGGSMADAAISASVSLAGGPSTPAPATITSAKGIISSPTAFSDASTSLDPYFVGAQAPSGFSSNLSIGVVPAQPGSVPRGPLFVAKTKPAVTNAVVGQPLVNLRARVVNDIGSVGRLHGENGGGLSANLG